MNHPSHTFRELPNSFLRRRVRGVIARLGLLSVGGVLFLSGGFAAPAQPKPGIPFENSLGMKFVPVPRANVLFGVYETRVQDFAAFAKATGFKAEGKFYTWINEIGKPYEWCEDTEYKAGDNQRVMRGAGFNSRTKAMLLSSNRIHFDSGDRSANHGFRCVLELDAPAK